MATTKTTRSRQSLLLGAVGDALGRPVEFWKTSRIEDEYGTEPPESLAYAGSPPAKITDDTQMTLFMAEGLEHVLERGVGDDRTLFREEIADSLLDWLATQDGRLLDDVDDGRSRLLDVEALHDQRAPGNTCLSSCRHIYRHDRLPDMDNRINDSKGCGAVMRSAPFGIGAASYQQAFGWARDASVLTHCHPSGYLSAAYFAAVIFGLVTGNELEDAMGEADRLLAEERGGDETETAVERARRAAGDGSLSFEALVELGEGWVGEEALSMALATALAFGDGDDEAVRRLLWQSVRHSGDSDSTGAMTGNLLGAMADEASMPETWLDDLELREVVDDCARRLAEASSFPS